MKQKWFPVQTLPEVRDWLWYQLLAAMPGGARWPEARILWLMVLIGIYRMVSIFPWLGSCTPAGDAIVFHSNLGVFWYFSHISRYVWALSYWLRPLRPATGNCSLL